MSRRPKRGKAVYAGRLPWMDSLLYWTQGVGHGGRPTYAHAEHGNGYEIEPVPGKPYYRCTVFAVDRSSARVQYLDNNGRHVDTPFAFRSPDAALIAVGKHYTRLRASKHHAGPVTHAFRSRFNRA